MEPITHFLTGACLARSGFNRRTALATATMTLAAEAPDVDVLASLKGPVFGFAHHRGFTHSFLGLFLVSAVVVAFVYSIWRLRGRKLSHPDLPPRWGRLYLCAYLAGLSHILLDYTNNYGVRPFWPASEKWYSADIVFIVEPALLLLLIGGLVAPWLWRTITRHNRDLRALSALLALSGVLAVWAIRSFEHQRAVRALLTQTYAGETPIRASAFPYWWNPFRWMGVAETRTSVATLPLWTDRDSVVDATRLKLYPKPLETRVTQAAKSSYLGRVYLDWAQYPQADETALASGYTIRFRDLRFAYPERADTNTLAAQVILDENLGVVREEMGRAMRIEKSPNR